MGLVGYKELSLEGPEPATGGITRNATGGIPNLAVREQDGDTLIVAPGTSCRAQILDGTGQVALHPAEVLHRAL